MLIDRTANGTFDDRSHAPAWECFNGRSAFGFERDAERPGLPSHALRGNDQSEDAQKTCGSEPAREGGGSVRKKPTDTPLSRTGSLPHLECVALLYLQVNFPATAPVSKRPVIFNVRFTLSPLSALDVYRSSENHRYLSSLTGVQIHQHRFNHSITRPECTPMFAICPAPASPSGFHYSVGLERRYTTPQRFCRGLV